MSQYIKIKATDQLYKFEVAAGQKVTSDLLLSQVDTSHLNDYEEIDEASIDQEKIIGIQPPHIEEISLGKYEDYVPPYNGDPSIGAAIARNQASYRWETLPEKTKRCLWDVISPEEKNIAKQAKPVITVANFKVPIKDAGGNALRVSEVIIHKSNTIRHLGESLMDFSVSVPQISKVNGALKLAFEASRGFMIVARVLPWVGLALTAYDVISFGICLSGERKKIPYPPVDMGVDTEDTWRGWSF